MISKENRRIAVVIPKEVYEKLSREAGLEDRTISNMAAKIIKKYYGLTKDDDD